MTRQVDLKALVSHIVKGDGMDRCRICMGDTSQGQVHLGDTVMMDGNHPVTLSELLEIITGVEVETDDSLPSTMCLHCYMSTYEAAQFRTLVQRANNQWTITLQLLEHLPDHQYSKTCEKVTAILTNDNMTVNIEHNIEEKLPNIDVLKRFGKQKSCECPNCGMKFMYSQHLYKHLKESADLIRACHLCAKIMTRDDLIAHLKEKHSVQPYDCRKCPALFLFSKQFNEHMNVAHAAGACTCGDCGRTFKSSPAYCAHLSVHSNRSCPNCDKSFRNQKCYYHHVKSCCNLDTMIVKNKNKITVTLNNKQNRKMKIGKRGSMSKKCICDYCHKDFSGKKFVAAHIQIVHTKATHKPCEICGKIFAAAHMTTHMKIHNSHLYKCQQCGTVLKSKLGFIQHLRLHTGERPYPCQHCGESFSASSRRSEHIRTMHLGSGIILKHGCKLCPARFKLPYKLRRHIITVHGDGCKDEAIYECKECKEKFASCRSLLHHTKKHNQTS